MHFTYMIVLINEIIKWLCIKAFRLVVLLKEANKKLLSLLWQTSGYWTSHNRNNQQLASFFTKNAFKLFDAGLLRKKNGFMKDFRTSSFTVISRVMKITTPASSFKSPCSLFT